MFFFFLFYVFIWSVVIKFVHFSSMVTLSLGFDDGRRHDLGTAIIYAGQRHNIEFYLNGRLLMQELALEPMDTLHIAVTKHETAGVDFFPTIGSPSDDASTLSIDGMSQGGFDDAEMPAPVVEEVASVSSAGEASSDLTVIGQPVIRCVPIEQLYSAEMLAYCRVNEGIHYVSLLRDEQ